MAPAAPAANRDPQENGVSALERRVLTGVHFMNGDTACAEGALAGGCTFFAGYPITPSTEIAERLARRLPEAGGVFVQMEDELGSMAAVLGAAWSGARAMTATSGPGFTLMMENIGWGMLTETPCVIVDVQRGGPATGLPTLASQGDVMQAKWGSHGDYEPIAYTPSSCQELFELTIRAFNTAERLRQPVFVLTDEIVGHMTERVTIPAAGAIPLADRKRPPVPPNGSEQLGDGRLRPFDAGPDLVPPMPLAGEGYRIHVTGLTHDEHGYPATNAPAHDRLVRRLAAKVVHHAPDLTVYEEIGLEDADVAVISYGCTARAARRAIADARAAGIRAGLLRLITLWPFPAQRIAALAEQVRGLVVAEMNLGQVAREVERCSRTSGLPVHWVTHAGGAMPLPAEIVAAVEEATP